MDIQDFIARWTKRSTFDHDACCGSLWSNYRLSTAACERIADYIIADRDTIIQLRQYKRIPELNGPPRFPFTYGFYGEGDTIHPHLAKSPCSLGAKEVQDGSRV